MRQLLQAPRWVWVLVAVPIIAGLAVGGIALAGSSNPLPASQLQNVPVPTPTPWPTPTLQNQNEPVRTMSPEEQTDWLEHAKEVNRNNGGFEYNTCGPSTMGSTIYIKGRSIKLPDDAYVESWVLLIECVGPSCPEPPIYVIARGDSRITVEQTSGKILSEEIAQGDEGAFDFLKAALLSGDFEPLSDTPNAQFLTPTPTPPEPPRANQPVHEMTADEVASWVEIAQEKSGQHDGLEVTMCGSGALGVTISVGGKIVKLPDDAYIELMIAFTACPEGPRAPYYVITRSNSRIGVDQGSGEIWHEEIAPGQEGAFDFLKNATS